MATALLDLRFTLPDTIDADALAFGESKSRSRIDEWPMNSLRALMLMFAAIISDAPCASPHAAQSARARRSSMRRGRG
jgi:hypothetical protein